MGFEMALNALLQLEGGLVENPKDPGGITKDGISLRFLQNLDDEKLRIFGIFDTPNDETIRELSSEQISKIYKSEFWDQAPFDGIYDDWLRTRLFTTCVNLGMSPAVKCVQRASWAAMRNRNLIDDDGVLGDETIRMLNSLYYHDCQALEAAFLAEIAAEYRLICATHPEQKEFLNGWLNRAYMK